MEAQGRRSYHRVLAGVRRILLEADSPVRRVVGEERHRELVVGVRRMVPGLVEGGRRVLGEEVRGNLLLEAEESGRHSSPAEAGEGLGERRNARGPAVGVVDHMVLVVVGNGLGAEGLEELRIAVVEGMAGDSHGEEGPLAGEHLGEGAHIHHHKAALIVRGLVDAEVCGVDELTVWRGVLIRHDG